MRIPLFQLPSETERTAHPDKWHARPPFGPNDKEAGARRATGAWGMIWPSGSRRRSPMSTEPAESTFHLIERARRGDQDALERLFARHLKPLQRWAQGRLPRWARDLADTDDLVQDALAKTFKRLDAFEVRGVGALRAYLRQAVTNRITDELRRKGRPLALTDLDGIELDDAQSPLEQAIGREAVERYEQGLQRLTAQERELVIARVEQGYSYEELAEAVGKPTAEAARKAARRALLRLAAEMSRDVG